MKKILYFAYGSNLLSDRLRHRIGSAEHVENYRLMNYKLTFDCAGFANIQPTENNYVEGCLYRITSEQLSELNTYEALYNAEFFDYDKDTIVVVYIGKERVIERSKFISNMINHDYLEIIMRGLLEKGLLNTYNIVKELFDSLPKRTKVNNRPLRKMKKSTKNRR